MTYTTIYLLRTGCSKRAERLRELLQGKTYMNLDVCCAPDGGELQVSVSTTYEFEADDDAERELLEMTSGVLAFEASR